MTEVSKTGVWVDSKTKQVVESQPEEGQQLIPPGSEITPAMRDAVEAARALAGDGAEQSAVVETADEPEAVDTATVSGKRSR